MSGPIHSLEAHYYTDPHIFEVEKAGLLAKTWQFGCHSSEIEQVGSFCTFEIAGESLFAIRGRDEKIRVFYNVCQHRAHQLVQGSGKTSVVVCPYHAWSYELTGNCALAPTSMRLKGLRNPIFAYKKCDAKNFWVLCLSISTPLPNLWMFGSLKHGRN